MISFTCKYCEENFEFKKSTQCAGHVRNCNQNPNRQCYIDKIAQTRKISNEKRRQQKYKDNPKYCLNCNEQIFNYSKTFCNHSCAASYTNVLKGPRSQECRDKISKTLTKPIITVEKTCPECDNVFLTKKNTFCSQLCSRRNALKQNHIKGVSKETRLKISNTRKQLFKDNKLQVTGGAIRSKGSWHNTWFGKKVYLRSQNEINYANILDSKKINYTVENLRIEYFDTEQNTYRISIPDFYLPKSNMIVEVKSTYTLKIGKQNLRNKIKEYLNLNYNVMIIVNDRPFIILNVN